MNDIHIQEIYIKTEVKDEDGRVPATNSEITTTFVTPQLLDIKESIEEYAKVNVKPETLNDLICQTKTENTANKIKQEELIIQSLPEGTVLSTPKPYECKECNYTASHPSNLIRHRRIHTGERPFHCSACDYKARDRSTLRRHIRTHTGEKPNKCNTCEYITSQKSALVKHLRIHSGEKPYKCTLCVYNAREKGALIKHMRMHSGEKPFKCLFCHYGASASCDLKRHMKTHRNLT